MTNIDNQDINKYIKCSRCHMKLINDDEHIKNDFGYNRLNERYKQCVRCRTKRTEYRNNNIDHARKMDKIYYENNKEQKLAYNAEIIECDLCGKQVRRDWLKQHKMSMNCINNCNECHLCGKKVSFKSMDNMLIHHYVKEKEILINIWKSLVHTILWTKNILLMVILILMVLVNWNNMKK